LATKILQIFSRYSDRGGEELAIERISRVLSDSYQLSSCFFSNADWSRDDAPSSFKQALWTIDNPDAVAQVRRKQAESSSDVWLVHNVFPVGSAAIFREASRLNAPIIYYIHNFRPFSVNGYLWAGGQIARGGLRQNFLREIYYGAWQNSRTKTAWLAFVLRLTYKRGWWNSIKAWIAISDFMRHRFEDAGVPASKIFTLRHPWRCMPSVPVPRQNQNYYLYLGRLSEPKGLFILLKAWNIVGTRLGSKSPKLVIAGEGELTNEVRSVASDRGSNVEHAGHVDGERKFELLRNCQALIAPSLWWEPLGLTTYEAYDFGKPVLAARSGGLTETVVHNETGMLHEPGNVEQLAEQIIKLNESRETRVKMGAQGRKWLMENANEEKWRQRFSEIVEFAIAEKDI
jgi:glycosyltransferase involved in cell wall biosynthesis